MALDDPHSPDISTAQGTAALAARYGADRPDGIHWNPTIAQLLTHRTVRAFTPAPLPSGTIETLIAAAQSAPTSSNLQLWSVVAVEDAAVRARLAELAGGQRHITEAPAILLFIADLARVRLIAGDAAASAEGYDFLESFTVAAIDAALAAQNALVAAESLGLGTCYIGALRNRPEDVAAAAGLPPHATVVFGLVVGHGDPERAPGIKPRLPQSVVLHRESYGLESQREAIARYDETARAFQQDHGQEPVGWRALVIGRGRNAAALNGRDRLKAALRGLGFPLR
jgi:nitroreductase